MDLSHQNRISGQYNWCAFDSGNLNFGGNYSGGGFQSLFLEINGAEPSGPLCWRNCKVVNTVLPWAQQYIIGITQIDCADKSFSGALLTWDGSGRIESTLGAVHNEDSSVMVYALTEYQGQLVIGGWFQTANDVSLNNIAIWNGNIWAPLGEGLPRPVMDLVIHNGVLVACHGNPYNDFGVSYWDGSNWILIGVAENADMNCLVVHDGLLVVGGRFKEINSVPAQNIAVWDGYTWHPLGSGTNGTVYTLKSDGDNLWVGGSFSMAGDIVSLGLAQWTSELIGTYLTHFSAKWVGNSATVSCEIPNPNTIGLYRVFRSSDGTNLSQIEEDISTSVVIFTFLDQHAPPEGADYHLHHIRPDGGSVLLGKATLPPSPVAGDRLALRPNCPNPFNPQTTLSFTLASPDHIRLSVYDVRGRLVTVLQDNDLPTGDYSVTWNGFDQDGKSMPTGTYLARLEGTGLVRSCKMVLAQ